MKPHNKVQLKSPRAAASDLRYYYKKAQWQAADIESTRVNAIAVDVREKIYCSVILTFISSEEVLSIDCQVNFLTFSHPGKYKHCLTFTQQHSEKFTPNAYGKKQIKFANSLIRSPVITGAGKAVLQTNHKSQLKQ